jgi:hypothetical protein
MPLSEQSRSRTVFLIALSLIATGCLAIHDLMVPDSEQWFRFLGPLIFAGPIVLLAGALMLASLLRKNAGGRSRWISLAAIAGFVGGLMIFPGLSAFADLAGRWKWARSGGAGESADWGEPLFYIIFGAGTAGLVGAVLSMSLAAAIRSVTSRHSNTGKLNEKRNV